LTYSPVKWKNAKIVPILKPENNPALTSSYRQISSLASICKLFDKLNLNRMLVYIDDS